MDTSEPGAPGKTVLPRWGSLVLTAAFLVGGGVFLLRQRALFSSVEIDAAFLLPLALAEGVMLVVRGLMTRELCRAFNVRLRVAESISLASWTTLANYVAPLAGGVGTRAIYLKRRHGLLYSHFLSLHAGTYAAHFWIGGLFGVGALGLLPTVPAAAKILLTTLFLSAFATGSLLMFAPRWFRRLGIRGGERVARVIEGAERLSAQRRWVILSLLVLNLLAMGTALFCAFKLLGVALGPVESLLLASVTSYSVLLSITPASFGITEGVIAFSAGLVGVPVPVSLAAAGFKRIVSLGATVLCLFATGRQSSPSDESSGGAA